MNILYITNKIYKESTNNYTWDSYWCLNFCDHKLFNFEDIFFSMD